MATPTLSHLPNEILSLVSSYLERPSDVLNLALSSRRLHAYTKLDGWKAFLKGRFNIEGLDSDAKNSVHGITTLYRNWDRKAFVARRLSPGPKVRSLNTWNEGQWRGSRGQTMGYQPKIDSYEEIVGGCWSDRREALAWSAGTHILFRTKETGKKAQSIWERKNEKDPGTENLDKFDDFRALNSWYTYQIPQSFEGRDDITALKLLRPHQKHGEDIVGIAFGSASGLLSLLRVDTEGQTLSEQKYATEGRVVGSLSISSCADPLMATTLGDDTIALYALKSSDRTTEEPQHNVIPDPDPDPDSDSDVSIEETAQGPISTATPIIPGTRNGRLWSTTFLSPSTLAIGLGLSYEPIQVYSVIPTGFSAEPLRKFSLDFKFWSGDRNNAQPTRSTSIYPILPVPADAQAGGGSEGGNVFLSGGHDGIVRLHDMRSPNDYETIFWDVTNDSSIYSLALQGLERVVAGISMHSMLKVFDLRVSGSHAYHHLPPACGQNPKPKTTPALKKSQDMTYNPTVDNASRGTPNTGGWNLYLNPRNSARGSHTNHRAPRIADSPVYSLSIPSPTSPSLYCGIEGAIMHLHFLSILDPHPDPLLSPIVRRFPDTQHVDVKSTYNPSDEVLNLGMYEQGNEDGLGMQLMVQDGISMGVRKNVELRDYARFRGLDERWKDPGAGAERWSRGREPELAIRGGPQRGGRGGRGGGRTDREGRGRGRTGRGNRGA
ncbi:hypothetical protein K504DRAFT_461204 [Pleomassaria siparia CBS 279.74]|uniref:F-box domain-containing protein n=1 Tax=Pleomassaria siparia CBS 279.74 TaxID=1314801 RepID=A0A6G1JW46_9PLEO|nr:hypothetical protein K504DRAFT_461204 [Pleomassaria siparia CBS 279.74]